MVLVMSNNEIQLRLEILVTDDSQEILYGYLLRRDASTIR